MWGKSSNQPEYEDLSKSGLESCVNCKGLLVGSKRIGVEVVANKGIRVPRSEDMSESDIAEESIYSMSVNAYMHVTCYRACIESIKYYRGIANLMTGGALATSFIFIQALLGLSSLNWSGLISIIAFAAALPPLVAAAFTTSLQGLREDFLKVSPTILLPENDTDNSQFLLIGLIIEGVAICAAFWHISWIAGIVLLISIVAVCISAFLNKKK